MMHEPREIERFECAPGLRLQAHENISAVHRENMQMRFDRIEQMMERLERRLWLTVYGVVAVILAQAVQSFLVVAP
ncbi:GTA head formation protein, RCAP_rcc01685 family [Sulfitobacter delicatus]|jgi:hypothetical protein|uniref:Gene transfer agent protein n=1 Tax=Sulfitobacter delicatus TaxID=218672 RepID=A0A1G7PKH8_9RHOB|nr:hypothetical protein [Sulfitobacter delicatus]SDF86728.1 hypothetical protein SAMN04489759_103363 [Sulfitobacter delicatus]